MEKNEFLDDFLAKAEYQKSNINNDNFDERDFEDSPQSNVIYTDANLEFYEEFFQVDDLKDLIQLLLTKKIYYQVEKPTKTIGDNIILGTRLSPFAVMYVQKKDFDRIETLREEDLMTKVNGKVPQDYHLRSFSDFDLLLLVKEPSKWHFNDWVFAKKLLIERGIDFDEPNKTFTSHSIKANIETFQPQKSFSNTKLMLLSIFCILMSMSGNYLTFAFALPFPFFLWYGKSKDLNGVSYPTYDEKSRQWGLIIFVLCFIFFMIGLRLGLEVSLESL